jgi:hypothetical protein
MFKEILQKNKKRILKCNWYISEIIYCCRDRGRLDRIFSFVFCTKKMQAGRLRSQLKYFLVIHLNLKSKITKSDFSDFSVSSVVNKKNIPLIYYKKIKIEF